VFKRLLLVLLILLVMFGGVFGWKYYVGKKMAAAMSAPPPPAVIASARVQSERWQPRLSAVGSLVASEGVLVANEVAGMVKSIHFDSGQQVEAGTLLVQLDDEADRADLAALVAARTLAELNFQRLKILIPGKTVSQSSYDEAKATLDGAVARVASSRANIAKKAIRAPFTGVLGIRTVDLGQYLAPGSSIVSLQALNPVYADYSLPERYLGKLSVGQPVEVRVQAYPERVFAGTISAVSPRIESATRSVRLRATLDNPDLALKPGMYAEVDTALPAIDKVMTLPERAIAYNPYGNSVFFIEEKDGGLVVQSRQIKTGEVRDGRIEIIEGLKEGDQVVSDGLNKLRNGQAVKIDNSVRLDASPAAP
jgi:membrane fusion protein (multidrug efflux system)